MPTPVQALTGAIEELAREVADLRYPTPITIDDALEYVDADIISAWFIGSVNDPQNSRSRLVEAVGESMAKMDESDTCEFVARLCADPRGLGEIIQRRLKLWVADWLREQAQGRADYLADNYDPSDRELDRFNAWIPASDDDFKVSER